MNGPTGDKGGGAVFAAPGAQKQESMKDDLKLGEKAATKDYELSEKKLKNHFRWIMLFCLPILTLLWLGLIVWMIFSERIDGIQIGIALGATGAGLLALLGLQIGWAYSQKTSTDADLVLRLLKAVSKSSE